MEDGMGADRMFREASSGSTAPETSVKLGLEDIARFFCEAYKANLADKDFREFSEELKGGHRFEIERNSYGCHPLLYVHSSRNRHGRTGEVIIKCGKRAIWGMHYSIFVSTWPSTAASAYEKSLMLIEALDFMRIAETKNRFPIGQFRSEDERITPKGRGLYWTCDNETTGRFDYLRGKEEVTLAERGEGRVAPQFALTRLYQGGLLGPLKLG